MSLTKSDLKAFRKILTKTVVEAFEAKKLATKSDFDELTTREDLIGGSNLIMAKINEIHFALRKHNLNTSEF